MSKSNELLNSLSDGDIALYTANPDTEPHIVIGEDRFVTVPEELQRIAVQYDNDIETVTFDCPRYWDEHDMSKMAVYINYLPHDGEVGQDVALNVRVDEEDPSIMHFEWKISGNVTVKEGRLIFLVDVKSGDGEHWHSELCEDMYVSEGLEPPPIIEITNPDVLTRILLFHSDVLELSDITLKRAAVYVGSGEMPDGYNVQVDPEGVSEFEEVVHKTTDDYLADYAPAVYVGSGEMPEPYSIQIDVDGEGPEMYGVYVLEEGETEVDAPEGTEIIVDPYAEESELDEKLAEIDKKLSEITSEIWSFTLEDDSVVTKEVYVK